MRGYVCIAAGGTYPRNPCHMWTYDDEVVPPNLVRGLVTLLEHSDCDGELVPDQCTQVADLLDWARDRLPDRGHTPYVRQQIERFSKGCRAAAEAGETLEFH